MLFSPIGRTMRLIISTDFLTKQIGQNHFLTEFQLLKSVKIKILTEKLGQNKASKFQSKHMNFDRIRLERWPPL